MSKKYFNKKIQENKKPIHKIKYPELIFSKEIIENKSKIILIVLLILSALIPSGFIYHLYNTKNIFGFSLDDPWIHLTFAKNLIEYESFSYFKNEIVTSGSTSPVYTIMLSLFLLITRNELFSSYFLGIVFFSFSCFVFYRLAKQYFSKENVLIFLIALFFVLQPKLNLIAVSGMETTMFIFFLLCSFYFYINFNKYLLGVSIGLLIWCRPDGFVFVVAIVLDIIYRTFFTKDKTFIEVHKKELGISFLISVVMIGIYFLFNYLLSGSILPNTFSAKIEYYQLNQREIFLKEEVLKFFTKDEFIILFIPFLIGIIFVVKDLLQKKYNSFLIFFTFSLGFVFVYYWKLPFSHRFGRYLMPVIPAFYIFALYGLKSIFEFIKEKGYNRYNKLLNVILILFILAGIFLSSYNIFLNADENANICKYHDERHVAMGKWINTNTPKNSIIATHDIGAIGYYGNRKLIDMVGLVSPELIKHLNDKNYSEYLKNYLIKQKVDYVALLRNWFELANENALYSPVNEPEFLEIFKFNPATTHFVPKEVTYINEQASYLLQQNNPEEARRYLEQSLLKDPKVSRTHFLLGAAYASLNDLTKAEEHFQSAISIFDKYAEGYYGLARIYAMQNKLAEAKENLDKCLAINPKFEPALELIKSLNKN